MSGADRSSHYQSGSESDLVPKTTIFGAPACRLTRQTIALTAALSGFVLAGTGAAVAGLQFQESFALIMGLLLVVVGIGLMCAGSGIFFYDSYFRRKNTDDLPTTMQLTETSTFGQAPSSSRGGQESLGSADAPPAYDSIISEPRRLENRTQSRSGAGHSRDFQSGSSHTNAAFEGNLNAGGAKSRSGSNSTRKPISGPDSTVV